MKFKFLDRERELKYTFKDILHLREKYSENDLPLDEIPAIVAIGLKREDPSINAKQVAEIIEMETFNELVSAVLQSSGLRKPDPAPRPTRESLETSGPSPDTTSGSPSENSGS